MHQLQCVRFKNRMGREGGEERQVLLQLIPPNYTASWGVQFRYPWPAGEREARAIGLRYLTNLLVWWGIRDACDRTYLDSSPHLHYHWPQSVFLSEHCINQATFALTTYLCMHLCWGNITSQMITLHNTPLCHDAMDV